MEATSFDEAWRNLLRPPSKRDPRSLRLASVTAALSDAIEGEVNANKIYALSISTLEGTLSRQQEDIQNAIDSLSTQIALLSIVEVVAPFVPPATISSSMALISRLFRGLVAFCHSTQDTLADTKDGLGPISVLLCSVCRAVSNIAGQVPTADQKALRKLLKDTLIQLLYDSRQSVQRAARNELCGLLNMTTSPCYSSIVDCANTFATSQMHTFQTSLANKKESRDLVVFLGFLQAANSALDFSNVGSRLMKFLMKLLDDEFSSPSSSVFAEKSRDSTRRSLAINATLSTILSFLASEVDGVKKDALASFTSRVLASLIQVNSSLVFRDGTVDDETIHNGRVVYGQVLLTSCQLLLEGRDPDIGLKLLPLTIQNILRLSGLDLAGDSFVAEKLVPELMLLIRIYLRPLKERLPQQYDSCLVRCLAILRAILQPQFRHALPLYLKTLALVLQQMNQEGDEVKACLAEMIALRLRTKDDKTSLDALDDAFAFYIQDTGVSSFWDRVEVSTLCSKAEAPGDYQWLFRTMKTAGAASGSSTVRLSFFHEQVLPLARYYDQNSGIQAQVLAIWSLFPLFCKEPVDLATSLPQLAPILVRAMNDQRYPQLVLILCSGLTCLADGVKKKVVALQELVDEEESKDVHLEAQVISKLSEKILPSLFKLVDNLHSGRNGEHRTSEDSANVEGSTDIADTVRAISQTIASFCKLASAQLRSTLLSKVIHGLLGASELGNQSVDRMCSLLALSQALVASGVLDLSNVVLLYRALKPLIRSDETKPRIQKRAYKVLTEICCNYESFVTNEENFDDLLGLMTSSTPTSHVAARYMRIKCMVEILNTVKRSSTDIDKTTTSELVGEVLLCMKDSNAKTRNAAYTLLVSIAELQDSTAGLFGVVAAAVASENAHMRSAALVALSRLVFEYGYRDPDVQALLPSLLKTLLLLSDDPAREVTKALVGFVRVCVSAISTEQLEPLLSDIVSSLLKYNRGKQRFRAKIKIILKKLVKLYGFDIIEPMVPKSEMRLLTHMRKLAEREDRRKRSGTSAPTAHGQDFDNLLASDEEDSDDGKTLVTRGTAISGLVSNNGLKRRRRHVASVLGSRTAKSEVGVRIRNDTNGEVLELADLAKKEMVDERELDDDDSLASLEYDESGKLVIPSADDMELDSKSNHDLDATTRSAHRGEESVKARRKGKPQRKLGSTYKAKKAGGDVRKRGQKYDPYAYVPLDGRNYSRKNRKQAVDEMGTVVNRGRKRRKK